jgi:A/G-specific adenine glycosylase
MKRVNEWFLENRRIFPWREEISPYRVWISEVMLQQTRASVVIPYFERWMKEFPDVVALAAAPIDQVIKAWEGLGYYSRARNLHAGAQQIIRDFGGVIPSTREELLKIKGLGPYTSASVEAFGFHRRAAPVDGNVLRVMSRFLWIDEDIGKLSTRKKIEALTEERLDEKAPWVTAEGLIELGATLCLPKPRCGECPLQNECKAALRGVPDALPIRSKVEKIESLVRGVAIVEAEGFVLVRKNGPGQVMADLFEFPYFEGARSPREIQKKLEELVGKKVRFSGKLEPVEHSFTRYKVRLFPCLFAIDRVKQIEGYQWVRTEELAKLPFSSGHRKIRRACEYSPS